MSMARTLKTLFKVTAFCLVTASTVIAPSISSAQPAGADIYVVDSHRNDPGYVYRLNTTNGDHDPVFWLPKGTIQSIAFNDKALYFVDGSSRYFVEDVGRHIYRSTDHCTTELIYTHNTYIREIQFDSGGALYFSESTGAAEAGTIFELTHDSTSNEYSANAKYSVPLSEVDGYWAGTFAFDPNDKLYVSSGNRVPASIYRYDTSGYTSVYRANNAIMGFSFIADDTLIYANHGQELRRLFNFTTETLFARSADIEWMGDVAFETGLNFTQLPDWNADGQGDACDCEDNYMGPNEDGADCGGACGGTCPSCVPVIETGGNAENIDIVFVPDKDYAGNMARFRSDVRQLILDGFMNEATLKANTCQFNFYMFQTQGDYVGTCKTFSVPPNLYATGNCPKDQTAIVFTGNDRACASGIGSGLFSVRAGQTSVLIHESGHATFELFDEYCSNGSCDGNYNEAAGRQSNVYHTEASCKANSKSPNACWKFCPETVCSDTTTNLANWGSTLADCKSWAIDVGVDSSKCVEEKVEGVTRVCAPNWRAQYSGPKKCDPAWTTSADCKTWATTHGLSTNRCQPHSTLANQFCYDNIKLACDDGGDGWWKADRTAAPNTCTMAGGSVFEPDCAARIIEMLAPGGVCNGVVNTASSGAPAPAPLAILLNLTYDGDVFEMDRMEIVRNYPPRFFPQEARFRLLLEISEGEVAFEMTLGDPRVRHVFATETEGPMKRLIEPASITLLLPFDPGISRLTITDQERGTEVLSSTLEVAFTRYCDDVPDDEACSRD